MPITRKLIAQDENEENQWLKVDNSQRYIVNDNQDWQFLFGPNSELTNSAQVLKIAAEFNKESFETIRFAAYLYNPVTGSVDNAGTMEFRVHLVTTPNWTDNLIHTFNGTQISNNYFYGDINLSTLSPIDFFGGDTIMIEAIATRLGRTYKDRIYVNHLGIFDNAFRLKQDIEFLDITKQDI